ncbi:hypothetical protein [Parasitella parasitica]|uniref:C2H2-type domain-containing protein n=1 Tax=Parasitella parasitica TaxID=35722 RepID=A0A0B7N8E2_9FUNG|nr:hypothetical protein [Parasitella parasitica]
MRHRAERIPQVIAIDISSDEFGDDEEVMDSSITQETESAAGVEEYTNEHYSNSVPSSAANSDDNALFDSEDDSNEQEARDQKVVESSEAAEASQNYTRKTVVIKRKVNNRVEKVLNACLTLLKNSKTSPTEMNQNYQEQQAAIQNSYINSYALQNGYGYYMNNKFYCFFDRESGCDASFSSNSLLSMHLEKVHNMPKTVVNNYSKSYYRDKKMAHWLIATNLPIKMVLNSHFNVFMRAICEQPSASVLAVYKDGLQRIIRAEAEVIFAELSQRLRSINHVSLVVSQWVDDNQQIILLMSVFFIDENWEKKTFVIAAEPIHTHETRADILIKIALVLKDLEILEKIYSIVCYETSLFKKSHLFAYIQKIIGKKEMCLSQDRMYGKLLDQMVTELRIELLSCLRYDCEPLKKILKEIDNCKQVFFIYWKNSLFKELQPYSIKLMKAYLENKHKHHVDCKMRLYIFSGLDEECMERIIRLDNELAYICDWLYEVAEKDRTIANKAYVICCELGDSIKKLAELRSTRRSVYTSSTARSFEISEAIKKTSYLKKPLEAMHNILSTYRSRIECGRAHVEAFVFDSYAYNDSYFSATKVLSLSKQKKNLTTILLDIAYQGDKRYRGFDIIDRLGFNNEKRNQYDDPDLATSTSNNIISGKRRRSNKSAIITGATPNQIIIDQIQLFHQMQLEHFKKYPDPSIVSNADLSYSRIMSILSDHTMVGQFNFWKQQKNAEQTPMLVQHTKKAFAVPTTSQECLKSFEPFKKLYVQNSQQETDADVDFICKRTLLSIWSVDFDLFKD